MIKLVSAVGLAALMLSPAMAASPARHHHQASAGYAQSTSEYEAGANGWASSDPSSNTVIVAGKYIGRDPDANVRTDLAREAGNEVD